jgi:hypothetical protein
MAKPTYKELLERVKPHTMMPVKPEQLGFTKPVIRTIGNLPLAGFFAETVKILKDMYQTNPEFKAMVDTDRAKGTDNTLRQLYHSLEVMAKDVTNEETKTALLSTPSSAAENIMGAFEKSLKATQPAAPVTETTKKTGFLSPEELKLFGFEQGKISPSATRDSYYEAIKAFNNSEAAGNMSIAEKSNFIDRFRETFKNAVKVKEDMLDQADLKFFKFRDRPLQSLNEIHPEINQDTAFEIAQSLHKKRLDPSIKKDLLTKLFNTIRDKKIKAHGGLNKYEEQWLDKTKLDKYFEAEVRPKTRIEFQEGQEPLTEEERKEFRRQDYLKQHAKPEEFQRVSEVVRAGLLQVTRLKDNLRKTNWQVEMDRLAKSLKSVIPPVGEMQEYVENIEKTLEGMDISSADLPLILNVEDGIYKPRLENLEIKNLMDRDKRLIDSLKKEGDKTKQDALKKAISDNRSIAVRLLKLRKLNLKGVKATVTRYIDYIKSKKDALATYQRDTVEARRNVKMIGDNIKELNNHFTDLMREEEFRIRWNRPSVPTPESPEDKKRIKELGKDFPESESAAQAKAREIGQAKKEPEFQTKLSMKTEKYQKAYEKFMGDADAIASLKDEVSDVAATLELKLKSIIEEGPSNKDNPYGGWGPSLDEMKAILNELVKKLDKYDLDKEIEKVKEFFDNLYMPGLFVELPKGEIEKNATFMFDAASKLRDFSESILKSAAERMEAPSNKTLMYDIAFPKKRETPLGPRAFPGFLKQDTNRLVERYLEYLEKEGLPDMISNPDADVSRQVDEGIKKSLRIPGKLGDYLANETRRRFLNDTELKKAREELVKIEKSMAGKTDETEKPVEEGLRDKLQTLRDKHIKQIEGALEFVLDPLEKLEKSVAGEKAKLPGAQKAEEAKISTLKDLITWSENKKNSKGISVMERIVNPDLKRTKESIQEEVAAWAKEPNNNEVIVGLKEGKRQGDISAFLKSYNDKFGTKYTDLPPWAEMRKDLNRFVNNELKGSVAKDKEDDKTFIDKFNEIAGTSFKELPSKKDIEDHWKVIEGTPLDLSKFIKSKEQALKSLKEMPKEVEKEVRKMPSDVTSSRWYKELQKDRSRHKTRWIENLLKGVTEPIDDDEKYKTGVDSLKSNIVSILNEKNEHINRVKKVPVSRIKAQFDEQLAATKAMLENVPKAGPVIDYRSPAEKKINVPKPEALNIRNFKVSVIQPLNAILAAKDSIGIMQEAKEGLITQYNNLKNFYEERARATPAGGDISEKFKMEKEQENVLNKINANISYYYSEIEKSKKVVDDMAARAYENSADFLKSISDLIKRGRTYQESKELAKVLDPKFTDLRSIIEEVKKFQEDYKKVIEHDKEVMLTVQEQTIPTKKRDIEKKAAPVTDPYGEYAQMSPYERALEERPGKEDLIVKDKPELYKKIEKTISYFKKVLKEGPSDSFKYFDEISKDVPSYIKALREEIIPGLKALLKQQVEIPGGTGNIITTLEDAVPTLENLMQEYSSENVKIKNRLEDEAKKYEGTLNKIRGLEEFINPKTGEFIDFTDQEKDMLKRLFLRQLYRSLDDLWAQIPAQIMPSMGPRDSEYYNNVWRAYKDFSGVKSNRRLMNFMNLVKADIRAKDTPGGEFEIKGMFLKSQQLEKRKEELERGVRELGLDPEKNKDIQELNGLIASMKKKERVVDKVFDKMLEGAELSYISKIRASLRDKMKAYAKDKEDQELIEELPTKTKEEKAAKAVSSEVDNMLTTVEKSKFTPSFKEDVDKTVARAESLIASLEKELSKGEWSIESSSYRNHKLFNPRILYGSTMQATIKDLLKWELQI